MGMTLKLDEKRLMNDLIKALNHEMDKVSQILVEFMIYEVNNFHGHDKEFDEWKADIIQAIKFKSRLEANTLVRDVGVLDQDFDLQYKALILNYGRGTLMDTTGNPWLQEYLNSEYYHGEDRPNGEIHAREGMEVYDINAGGWSESRAKNRNRLAFFDEKGGHFWSNVFGNSATLAKKYFDEGIQRAIDSIDFSDYLISSN